MAINKNEFKLKTRSEARRTKINVYSPKEFRRENSPTSQPERIKSSGWFIWFCIFGLTFAAFKYFKG